MTFRIHALDHMLFAPLFTMDDAALIASKTRRYTVASGQALPCRISLRDASPGETVLLTNYQHLDVDSPYAAIHAIYIRAGAERVELAADTVPEMIGSRLLSVRAIDQDGLFVRADVVEGRNIAAHLGSCFDDQHIDFVDIHSASAGCFLARSRRA